VRLLDPRFVDVLSGNVPIADPWYDFLALPIAPLVLLIQVAALFGRTWVVRWAMSIACVGAVTAMFFYVASLPTTTSEGVNIGAGVLLLWFLGSILLLIVLVVRELIVTALHGASSTNRQAKPS
jgi:hypothetical protein